MPIAENAEGFKDKRIGQTVPNGTLAVKIVVPLKHLSNFWRSLEMPLINTEVNLMLTWSKTCILSNATDSAVLQIDDTKPYVPEVTLGSEDNTKLLQQMKSGFKRSVFGMDISQSKLTWLMQMLGMII